MEDINRLKTELGNAFAIGNVEQAFSALKEIHDKKITLKLNWTPELRMVRTMMPGAVRRSEESEDSPSLRPADRSYT